jgi:hypothetical protein
VGAYINGVYHEHPREAGISDETRAALESRARLTADAQRAHARIDAALSAYSFVLDREGGPAPVKLDALDLLSIIVTNAVLVPDPQMRGTTDTYAVPLDDIEAARTLLREAGRL